MRLRHDARTDVLVVGMGISRAMIAESLTAAGFAVILIDRRGPLLGSTLASTALVQYEIDVPLTRLSRTLGRGRSRTERHSVSTRVSHFAARALALTIC